MPSGFSLNPQTLVQLGMQGGVLPQLPPFLAFPQGKFWFVKPSSGNDQNNSGLSPDQAFKTVLRAYNAAAANRNDVIFLLGEGNSSDACTSRQISTLVWAKDCLHLIGLNSGVTVSPRSRIAWVAAYATASNLMTVSANGCYFANLQLFSGVVDTSPTGCLKVTGARNRFDNCHITGVGDTHNDITGFYALWMSGASENEFRDCTIGLSTIDRSTSKYEVLINGDSSRNEFRDCKFVRRIAATDCVFVTLDSATSIQDWLMFKRCSFIPTSTNYAVAAAAIMNIATLTAGFIQAEYCAVYASTKTTGTVPKFDVNDGNFIQALGVVTPPADTVMLARAV